MTRAFARSSGPAVFVSCAWILSAACYGQAVKEPSVAGQFYPRDADILSRQIDGFLRKASPAEVKGDIFCLISPHAGYEFSGQTAAFGYKLIQGRDYKTVVVLGPSHYYGFNGISVYAGGAFRTPLGDLPIDSDFAQKIIDPSAGISFIPEPFEREHSVEVQLPFLQKALSGFKIVPVIAGSCDFKCLQNFSERLVKAIGRRKDVLVVASTDLTHSYDYQETEIIDKLNLGYLEAMSAEDLYEKLKEGTAQMCGGLPVVAAMLSSKKMGYNKLKILSYTNSAEVTAKKIKGFWDVGYVSAIIDQEKSEEGMLNAAQKNKLLEIARKAIEEYLISGKRVDFKEDDALLKEIRGAFVTLHRSGELRGCIGNIVGQKPIFETVRDMAIESATADPRFNPVTKDELKDIEIEISVLSPLKKITNADEFRLGAHGVLVRRGWNQGVFLPQVATETGWSREEFLSYLCSHKAGLAPDAWKGPGVELFIFSAQVFSEKELK